MSEGGETIDDMGLAREMATEEDKIRNIGERLKSAADIDVEIDAAANEAAEKVKDAFEQKDVGDPRVEAFRERVKQLLVVDLSTIDPLRAEEAGDYPISPKATEWVMDVGMAEFDRRVSQIGEDDDWGTEIKNIEDNLIDFVDFVKMGLAGNEFNSRQLMINTWNRVEFLKDEGDREIGKLGYGAEESYKQTILDSTEKNITDVTENTRLRIVGSILGALGRNDAYTAFANMQNEAEFMNQPLESVFDQYTDAIRDMRDDIPEDKRKKLADDAFFSQGFVWSSAQEQYIR